MIYFMCYPRGDRSRVTVIDTDWLYEMEDYDRPDKEHFHSRDEAIMHARNFAFLYDMKYDLFESRYDSELNEILGEFEDDYNKSRERAKSSYEPLDLEDIIIKVSDDVYQTLLDDVNSEKIDSVGHLRLRLFRIFSEEQS